MRLFAQLINISVRTEDSFAKDYLMNETKRGDLIAFLSAGAFGEIMASHYNLRKLPTAYTSVEI
jgi:diaminopimelate decarboxylase